MKRILTALLLVPILIAIIGYAPPPYFLALVAIATALALEEFFSIAMKSSLEVNRLWGHAIALLLLASFYVSPGNVLPCFLILTSSALLLLALGIRQNKLQDTLAGASATVLGLVYIPVTLGLMVALQRTATPWGAGNHWIFFLLLVVWFGDTGAYYVGRLFGKHPLAPGVSPKKTVEGALGGFLGNVLAALLAKEILLPLAPNSDLLLLSILLGAVSQIGDLSESAIKRGARVKDSSNLLPGHGGMLDRIDGVLFAAPVMFGYLRLSFDWRSL
jgi:phosphatidate cytidylyltransferase